MKLVVILIALVLNVHSIRAFSLKEFFEDLFNINQPTYKLSYFDIRARGEFIRFILHYAGQSFEDNRIKNSDWPTLKPTTPFGQLPVLQIKKGSEIIEISQSLAIARYLANKFGLGGNSNLENGLVDMYGGQIADLFNAYFTALNNNQTDKFIDSTWIQNFEFFENRIAKSGNGFLIGKSLKWIDIYLSQITEFLGNRKTEILGKFPRIKQLDLLVRNIPGIAQWIQKRPDTPI